MELGEFKSVRLWRPLGERSDPDNGENLNILFSSYPKTVFLVLPSFSPEGLAVTEAANVSASPVAEYGWNSDDGRLPSENWSGCLFCEEIVRRELRNALGDDDSAIRLHGR
jgi:hypothetical protein